MYESLDGKLINVTTADQKRMKNQFQNFVIKKLE